MPAYEVFAKTIAEFGLQTGMLILFVWYFLKRDKEREQSLTEEKVKLKVEFSNQQDELNKKLESYRKNQREKEALLMSENAKREELIKKESDKREDIIKAEAMKREESLMLQINKQNDSLQKISTSMENINSVSSQILKSVEDLSFRMNELEQRVDCKK